MTKPQMLNRRKWNCMYLNQRQHKYTMMELVKLIIISNRHRQDTLAIEKKFKTHRWDMRVNLTILSIISVDTWLVYSRATECTESQKQFYNGLSEKMINNSLDKTISHERRNNCESRNYQPCQFKWWICKWFTHSCHTS